MDIYPVQLIKAIMVEDIDKMEQLGIYEVDEEDFALCEYVCTSKTEVQSIIRSGLDLMRKEMS
jgi:Na+-transporting NADH:ubiquinone oxidoreductase subunit A